MTNRTAGVAELKSARVGVFVAASRWLCEALQLPFRDKLMSILLARGAKSE